MSGADWRPAASLEVLHARAAMLARIRAYFAAQEVDEVQTPALSAAAVSDPAIESVAALTAGGGRKFLQTSPEYPMKRLLAAGFGDCYQVCPVFRDGEAGRHHNPEFTMIEWYRAGFTMDAMMSDVDALVRKLLGHEAVHMRVERLTWRDAFVRHVRFDPVDTARAQLERTAVECGFAPQDAKASDRDTLLDLIVSARVGPRLGRGTLTFVHHYPASQAALARLDPEDPRFALRFELYCEGIELANGFVELGASGEQRERFERDREERARRKLPRTPVDERLLAALESGLPDCAGVALGFDRVLMLAAGATHIDEVLPFPIERA